LASKLQVHFLQAPGQPRSIIALGRSELSGKEKFYLTASALYFLRVQQLMV